MISRRALLATILLNTGGNGLAVESAHAGLSQQDWSCAQATSKAIQVPMSNSGLIDQNKVDNDRTEITLLAKQPLPRGETRQVFLLILHESGGRTVSLIAQSKTGHLFSTPQSANECPYDDPTGYIVSQTI